MKHYESQFDLSQLNVPNGATLRDSGIAKVLSHNQLWRERCLEAFSSFADPALVKTFTGEEFRFYCEGKGLYPDHPNAWGGLINILVRRKLIVPTGEYVKPTDKTSHARRIQVYRRSFLTI